MQLGLACDVIHEAASTDAAEAANAVEPSMEHYAESARLCSLDWAIFDLWHHAIAVHPTYAGRPERVKAAQAAVHAQAVSAGIWAHPMQRPSHFIKGLEGQAWWDPSRFPACRALQQAYETIRAEALELLQVDAEEIRRAAKASPVDARGAPSPPTGVFCSYLSAVLESGDWADVGLYYNGRRNDGNAKRAPRTSSLLCTSKALKRDATSCPFGSAYFSLLRPGTRLGAHCGPTNGRLRAHLGLVVPEDEAGGKELRIRCGDEARRWAEGEILLFDDAFEHEVWNLTSQPRLVLIVDLWHPQLDTDDKRLAAMNSQLERDIYLGVVKRNEYGNTIERGH